MTHLLSLRSVSKVFTLGSREVRAVENVSLDVEEGECLAIVGESGSGKSTVANMVLGIYPPSEGEVLLRGEALPARRQLVHRRAIQLVQQNPMSSLNPRRSIGASLRLALDVHGVGERGQRRRRVGELLEEVGLPAGFAARSPAALSGGQRQRVAIAAAIAARPALLIADEPTSALDTIVQARIVSLLDALVREDGMTLLFVTHDIALASGFADRIAVLHEGRLVEEGPAADVLAAPRDACTRTLVAGHIGLDTLPLIGEAAP